MYDDLAVRRLAEGSRALAGLPVAGIEPDDLNPEAVTVTGRR